MAEAACSGDMRNYSHEFIVQFIELYKSYPCLWKIKSKEYSNKTMKQEAYEVLVQKLREVDVNVDKHAVVKHINNLRSCYRKEAKKVKKSMLSGSGVDSVYVPKLWYYKYLHFLYDQELPSPSTGNMSESEEENKDDDELTERENMSPFSDDPPTPSSSGSGGNLVRKRKAAPSKQDEILNLIAKKSPHRARDTMRYMSLKD